MVQRASVPAGRARAISPRHAARKPCGGLTGEPAGREGAAVAAVEDQHLLPGHAGATPRSAMEPLVPRHGCQCGESDCSCGADPGKPTRPACGGGRIDRVPEPLRAQAPGRDGRLARRAARGAGARPVPRRWCRRPRTPATAKPGPKATGRPSVPGAGGRAWVRRGRPAPRSRRGCRSSAATRRITTSMSAAVSPPFSRVRRAASAAMGEASRKAASMRRHTPVAATASAKDRGKWRSATPHPSMTRRITASRGGADAGCGRPRGSRPW